jgi:hypothetical protein
MDGNDSIILDISRSSTNTKPKKYFCNHCNRSLFLKDKDTQEYICTNCTITYYPNHQLLKKANKFDLPGPTTDEHGNVVGDKTIPIAMIDDSNKELSTTSYQSQKLSPSFEALKKQGFKITSYEERLTGTKSSSSGVTT